MNHEGRIFPGKLQGNVVKEKGLPRPWSTLDADEEGFSSIVIQGHNFPLNKLLMGSQEIFMIEETFRCRDG